MSRQRKPRPFVGLYHRDLQSRLVRTRPAADPGILGVAHCDACGSRAQLRRVTNGYRCEPCHRHLTDAQVQNLQPKQNKEKIK